ncbi:MAG: methionine--tRNA ligase [Candidatus Diapherotrites archaeon]|nr:methionine--tRNA ligase [Candidatus Diapherotrites archaeon]
MVSFNDWSKIELKIATIKEIEDIPGKDKLYKLSIDIGEPEHRTLVAGLKGFYSKDDLQGKQIVVVANLDPKPLAGILSQGMLLAADEDSRPVLLNLDKEVTPGTKVI